MKSSTKGTEQVQCSTMERVGPMITSKRTMGLREDTLSALEAGGETTSWQMLCHPRVHNFSDPNAIVGFDHVFDC